MIAAHVFCGPITWYLCAVIGMQSHLDNFDHVHSSFKTMSVKRTSTDHGPLTRYVILWVAHAPGMPGTFSPPPRFDDPDMHHDTCVTHVPWCMSGSLTSGFLWSRWRGKRSRHSRRMRNPLFCVSGKRSMDEMCKAKVGRFVAELYDRSEIRQAHQCLSNFKAMRWFRLPISRLRDFTGSYDKTSYRISKQGPGQLSTVISLQFVYNYIIH